MAHHAESDDVAGIALFSGAAWNELDEVDAVPLLDAGRLDSGSGLQATGESKLSFKAEPYNALPTGEWRSHESSHVQHGERAADCYVCLV